MGSALSLVAYALILHGCNARKLLSGSACLLGVLELATAESMFEIAAFWKGSLQPLGKSNFEIHTKGPLGRRQIPCKPIIWLKAWHKRRAKAKATAALEKSTLTLDA